MADNPLESLIAYSAFLAEVLTRPTVTASTVTAWSDSPYTGIAEGEVVFASGLRLRLREEVDFDAGLIVSYGYEPAGDSQRNGRPGQRAGLAPGAPARLEARQEACATTRCHVTPLQTDLPPKRLNASSLRQRYGPRYAGEPRPLRNTRIRVGARRGGGAPWQVIVGWASPTRCDRRSHRQTVAHSVGDAHPTMTGGDHPRTLRRHDLVASRSPWSGLRLVATAKGRVTRSDHAQ